MAAWSRGSGTTRGLLALLALWAAFLLLGLPRDAEQPAKPWQEGSAVREVATAEHTNAFENERWSAHTNELAGVDRVGIVGKRRDSASEVSIGKQLGTRKHVVVVEDAECMFRTPEVVRWCGSLETAYSKYCSHRGFDSHYHHGYIAAFRIMAPFMASVGVEHYTSVRMDDEKQMKRLVKGADVIITLAMLVPALMPMTRAKFVVVERADAAPIVEDNFYKINSNRVMAVLKHTSLHPISRNNDDPLIHGRHHYVQLDPTQAASAKKRYPPLSSSALHKVHAMVPQVFRFRFPTECGGKRHYLHLLPALLPQPTGNSSGGDPQPPFLKPLAQRSIDIAFLGGTQEHEVLKKHRANAAAAIHAMGSRHPQLRVVAGLKKTKTVGEFYELLRDVKFFVSPYGYGEFANKDYEAILSGCVLVKPLAHQLTAFPNIYKPGVSAVDVKGDFSDLERAVLPLLKALPKAQTIADNALQKLRKFANPAVPAEHLSRLLQTVTQ